MHSLPPTELIVALDFPKADRAFRLLEQLQGLPLIYKIGLELFLHSGPEVVKEFVHRHQRVFLDLKLHDIPNTVAKAVRQAALLHVEMLTVHLTGGGGMIRALREELSEIPLLKPKILGVSVLTSFNDILWAEVSRSLTLHPIKIEDSVQGLVDSGVSWGVDGVVCSAIEVASIRKQYPSLYTVVPGIRPTGSDVNDQARVMTPAEAHQKGASAIVVGRPITQADEPRQAVEAILRDLVS